MAGKRAKWLVNHQAAWLPERHQASKCAMERGPVIAECRMDLDSITQWCPTVGLFASNIITIRNLAEPMVGDNVTDDDEGDK
ncbi:Hypothetical protein, putative [Bodo saltans]|uniref:Uncharacterized protein n=1 Tax=Bodo saltans TaxID=75058 RepID=A0A0S4JHF1_BODSA|nr:Hypothetical protein, putative [Bodo saltans]|eukprot:CUG88875.1 Hypothetical protein, putative [Bodo saltans]